MNNSAYRKAPGRVSKNYSPNKAESTVVFTQKIRYEHRSKNFYNKHTK